MSGISFGKTAEQAALEFLSVLADPDSFRDKIRELKKQLEIVTTAQNGLTAQANDVRAAEERARQHREASEKAESSARKLNADTEDRRAEIARRQDEWERNLNVRETELKNADAAHADEVKRFEAYKTAQSNDLESRSKALAQRESDHGKRKAELDARQGAIESKEKAAAELLRVMGR